MNPKPNGKSQKKREILPYCSSFITICLTFAFFFLACVGSTQAIAIPSYRMESLILLSDEVIYCKEENVQIKQINNGTWNSPNLITKCKIEQTFKGDLKPGSELTIDYGALFDRSLGHSSDRKNLPPGFALVFLKKNQSGSYYVLDAKLVQHEKIYRYVQFGNPGGMGLVRQGPENIKTSEDYDGQELLKDVAVALKKSKVLKEAVPLNPFSPGDFDGFANPDDSITGISLEQLQRSTKYLYSTSKGRELQCLAEDQYKEDVFLETLKDALCVSEEDEYNTEDIDRKLNSNEQSATFAAEQQKNVGSWLERTCVPGTSLYLYQHLIRNQIVAGYCTIKNDIVVNSLTRPQPEVQEYFREEYLRQGEEPTLSIVNGDKQTSAPGTILPLPLIVLVKDLADKPMANAPVTFAVHSFRLEDKGGGILQDSRSGASGDPSDFQTVFTKSNGYAKIWFKQPFRANYDTKIVAYAGDARIEFNATTLPDNKPPADPSDVTVTLLNSLPGCVFRIQWRDISDNATGFIIYRSKDQGKTWTAVGVANSNTSEYIVPDSPDSVGDCKWKVTSTSPNDVSATGTVVGVAK